MKPRVMVSSVVESFGQFRQAAREAIVAAGGEPVLVNEDFPSLAVSSRNACLEAVDSSDILLTIIGARGGWTTPSGSLVSEEEYDRARERKIPVLVFLQEIRRDADADRFAGRVSDYVDGGFRGTFSTPEDLHGAIERALAPLLTTQLPQRMTQLGHRDHFSSPYRVPNTAMLRFVLTPERVEEVIDPVRLGSREFVQRVFEVGHHGDVRLLSYEVSKSSAITGNALVITQADAQGRHGEGAHIRLEISERGELVIDANVTGRVQRGSLHEMVNTLVVALEDIEEVLGMSFAFAAGFYDDIDRFKRHQRFAYNVALSGLDYRRLERTPKSRSSMTMGMRPRDAVLTAFDEQRVIGRVDLVNPASEITRAVTLLERKAES